MRIAYLVSKYPAPSHTFIRREVNALRRRGLRIQTFSIRRPGDHELLSDMDREDVADTFYVLPIPLRTLMWIHLIQFFRRPRNYLRTLVDTLQHRTPGTRSLLFAVFYFLEGIVLSRELERRGIDHLHNHFANAASHAGLAAVRYLGIGWSLTLHGLTDFEGQGGLLLGEKIATANFVVCVSGYGRAQAMRLSQPKEWPKLFVARCGVEMDKIPDRAPPEKQGRLRILYVGRFAAEKGQVGLVDAFAEAVRRGLEAELVMIGDGPFKKWVAERIVERGVQDRVHMPGRAPEAAVLDEIAGSDILVLSSFMEGLPVVLMEALALRVPVIAPSVAGIPELVEQGTTGLLFTAGEWDQLTERLLQLGNDPELRKKIGEAGRRRVEQEFDVDRAVGVLFTKFNELGGHPKTQTR